MEVAVVVGKMTHLLHLRGIMKEVAMTDMEAHRVAITKVTAATIIITTAVQEAGTTGTVEVTSIATTAEVATTTDPTWYIYFLISVIYIATWKVWIPRQDGQESKQVGQSRPIGRRQEEQQHG